MFRFVLDSDGNLRFVDDEDAPQRGFCPCCGAGMYKRDPSLKHSHYALLPGKAHGHPECKDMANRTRIPDLRLTKPDSFFKSFLRMAKPDLEPEEENDESKSRPTARVRARNQPEIIFTPVQTLSHLDTLGCLDSDNCRIGDTTWLSSISINPRFSYMLLGNYTIGQRVLQGRPVHYWDDSKTIQMKIFIAKNISGQSIKKYIIANLVFLHENVYTKVRNMLFRPATKTNVRSNLQKSDRIAVVGTWHRIPNNVCRRDCVLECDFGGWCCEGKIWTDIVEARQVHCVLNKTTHSNT